jgi:hypothetical protein
VLATAAEEVPPTAFKASAGFANPAVSATRGNDLKYVCDNRRGKLRNKA